MATYQGTNSVVMIGDGPETFQIADWVVDTPTLPELKVLVTEVREAPDGQSKLRLALKDGTIIEAPVYGDNIDNCTVVLTPEQVERLRVELK